MKIGYARCSTDRQDIAIQRVGLDRLGVDALNQFEDHGLTGRNRDRPNLRAALRAVRAGDELVVTKLDRLGRSVRDLHTIASELEERGVKLNIGGAVHDPRDPVGKLLFGVLALMAEFESDLNRARTREGMAIAKRNGRLKGKQPKLSTAQRTLLLELRDAGEHTIAELAAIFSVSRSTIYRSLQRDSHQATAAAAD